MLKTLDEETPDMTQEVEREANTEGAKAKAQKTRSEKGKGKKEKRSPDRKDKSKRKVPTTKFWKIRARTKRAKR